jgi:hypothetical protein
MKQGLALTEPQLRTHHLACTAPPPITNILTLRESTPVPDDDEEEEKITPTVGKLIAVDSDNEDLYEPTRGIPQMPLIQWSSQIPPEEEAFISAGLEHIATLEHANHPEEPLTHL